MKAESINEDGSAEVTLAPNYKQMCPFNSLNTWWESETAAPQLPICLIKSTGWILMRGRVMNEDRHVYRDV